VAIRRDITRRVLRPAPWLELERSRAGEDRRVGCSRPDDPDLGRGAGAAPTEVRSITSDGDLAVHNDRDRQALLSSASRQHTATLLRSHRCVIRRGHAPSLDSHASAARRRRLWPAPVKLAQPTSANTLGGWVGLRQDVLTATSRWRYPPRTLSPTHGNSSSAVYAPGLRRRGERLRLTEAAAKELVGAIWTAAGRAARELPPGRRPRADR
jgi:hypothetical protein